MKKEPNHVLLVLLCGHVQGGPAPLRFAAVDVGTGRHQQLGAFGIAGVDGYKERRESVVVLGVQIQTVGRLSRVRIQQQLNAVDQMPIFSCDVKRTGNRNETTISVFGNGIQKLKFVFTCFRRRLPGWDPLRSAKA